MLRTAGWASPPLSPRRRRPTSRVAAGGYSPLTVSVSNAPAQALYRKLGYVRTAEPPRRVQGTVQLRSGPLEVDDMLLTFEKRV